MYPQIQDREYLLQIGQGGHGIPLQQATLRAVRLLRSRSRTFLFVWFISRAELCLQHEYVKLTFLIQIGKHLDNNNGERSAFDA